MSLMMKKVPKRTSVALIKAFKSLVEGLMVDAPIVALNELFLNSSLRAANSSSFVSLMPRVLIEVEFLRVSFTNEESFPFVAAWALKCFELYLETKWLTTIEIGVRMMTTSASDQLMKTMKMMVIAMVAFPSNRVA